MIKCPGCGAELKYEIESESVVCSFCGNKFNPEELKVQANKSEEIADDVSKENKEEVNADNTEKNIDEKKSYEAKRFSCSQCGAELLTFDDTAVTFCSYCGSQAMIESRLIKINNPDYIIPFKKTKEECINNYKKKLRRNIFAPSYMKTDIVISKFRGIFMPYAVYKLSIHGNCSNTGEKFVKRRGDFLYYDDYALVSNIDSDYEGFTYDLASNYYDKFSGSIPFDIKEKQDFNINYLSGYYADKKDVSAFVYDSIAKNIAMKDASLRLSNRKEFRKYNCKKIKVPLDVTDRKMAMFPVYFLSVKDKDNKHINYAVVNGQTGEVAADVPIDFKKYILFAVVLAIIIFLIINEYLLILPIELLSFSVIVSFISGIISNNQLNKMVIKKEKRDDLGVVSKNQKINIVSDEDIGIRRRRITFSGFFKFVAIFCLFTSFEYVFFEQKGDFFDLVLKFLSSYFIIFFFLSFVLVLPFSIIFMLEKWIDNDSHKQSKNDFVDKSLKKMPLKEKFRKYLYKQILAFVVGIIIIVVKPVYDIYYYGGSIFVLSMVVFSFYDLVRERNEIISNELPQLGKRGGDENE